MATDRYPTEWSEKGLKLTGPCLSAATVQAEPRDLGFHGRFEGHRRCLVWCLTFELRRDQRQDASARTEKMYWYLRPGAGGLPLGLASSEGLGRTAMSGSDFQVPDAATAADS